MNQISRFSLPRSEQFDSVTVSEHVALRFAALGGRGAQAFPRRAVDIKIAHFCADALLKWETLFCASSVQDSGSMLT